MTLDTPKLRMRDAFCQEYVIDLNATQAAIRAGYSEKTAQVQGSQLLSNLMVQDRIKELREEAAKRNNTTVDMIDKMHKAAFKMAQDTRSGNAMTSAAQNLAKLHGLIIEKTHIQSLPTLNIEYIVPDADITD